MHILVQYSDELTCQDKIYADVQITTYRDLGLIHPINSGPLTLHSFFFKLSIQCSVFFKTKSKKMEKNYPRISISRYLL
jgi:hypothetical protein